jgi:hypothetical protein
MDETGEKGKPARSGQAGGFYEELEMLALESRSVEIVFRSGNGARTVVRDRIVGIYTLEGRECLRTAAGLVLGLDQLVDVDGRRASGAC